MRQQQSTNDESRDPTAIITLALTWNLLHKRKNNYSDKQHVDIQGGAKVGIQWSKKEKNI